VTVADHHPPDGAAVLAERPMRVCILTREYPPYTEAKGGIGTQWTHMAPAFARLGHDSAVVAMAPEGPSRTLDHGGAQVHLVPRPGPQRSWPLEDVLWARAGMRRVRELGPFDIVFSAEWGGDAGLYASRQDAGALVTLLSTSLPQMRAIMPGWERSRRWRARHALLQGPLERRQTERSTAIIASSQAILDWARSLWRIDGPPTVVLPNAVDVERTRRLAAEGTLPAGYPGDGPVVAFSGRLESRKGVHVLVAAMARVWAERPEAQVVLLGEDRLWEGKAMSAQLRDAAGPFADRLHVLGRQPPEHLFPALAAADVVVLPSLWENFALAGLEIMALGKPLIVSAAGGFPEMVTDGHDGLLFPPGDAPALAERIERLLADPELASAYGAEAERSARARFDVLPVAQAHLDFFASVKAAV